MKKLIITSGLLLYFLILGVLYTFPLIRYFDRGLPYTHASAENKPVVTLEQGDYIQLFYYMWLFKDALQGHTPFFKDPYQLNVPKYGLQEHFNNQYIPLAFFFSAFALLLGDQGGYNLLVLLTFPLAGLGMYRLAYLWTRVGWAALIAATIYALYPYRVVHLLGGHPGGFTHFFIPWIIYIYARALQKENWFLGFISGLIFLGLGMDEFHVAFYLPVFLGIFLILPLFRLHRVSSSTVDWEISQKDKNELKQFRSSRWTWGIGVLSFIFGLFLSLWMFRRSSSMWAWSLIPLGMVLIGGCWIFYSWLFSKLSGQNIEKSLKNDAISFLPFILFLIYPIQFFYEMEGLGSHLMMIVFGMCLGLKVYFMMKHQKSIFSNSGITLEFKKNLVKVFIAFVIPATTLVGWLMFEKITKLDSSVVSGGRSVGIIKLYSPSMTDIFKRFHENGEFFVYPGIFSVLLALAGFLMYKFLRKSFSLKEKVIFGISAGLFLLTYYLSFGPRLDHIFPLYNFFYQNVPHFNYIRVPTRILYLSFLFLSLLAAFGAKACFSLLKKKSMWIAIFLMIGICIDYLPAKSLGISLMPSGHSVYEHVQKNLNHKRVLALPIWPGESSWSSIYQYYATRHRLPMINGYRPAISWDYVKKVFYPLSAMNTGEVNEKIWKLLREFEVKFVVFHEEAFPGKVSPFPAHFTISRLKDNGFLKFIKQEGSLFLFEVLEEPDLLKGSSKIISPVFSLTQGESLKRKKGYEELLENASNGKVVTVDAEAGIGEWLLSQKARGYPSGHYQALFRLKGEFLAESKGVLRFELWNKEPHYLVVAKDFDSSEFQKESFKDFIVPFEVSDYAEIEPKVVYGGVGKISLDRISIGFLNISKNPWLLEAEDLYCQAAVVADAQASGGKVVKVNQGSPRRDVLFGPYTPFSKGNYKATFWIKVSDLTLKKHVNSSVVSLLVTTNYGQKIIAQKTLRLKDFTETQNYQPFRLEFTLDQDADLEFPVRFEEGVDCCIDRIEVEK